MHVLPCDRFQPCIDLAYSIPLCERFLPFITKLYVDVYCHPIDQDDYIEGARRHARPEDDERENMDEDMEEVEGGEEHVHEEHLNEQVLYDVSSGPRNHGRFAIANGAVRAADVRAAAKERTVRPSNPVSLQSMAREMARLCRANERLQQQNHAKDKALQQYQVTTDLTLVHIHETLFSFVQHIFVRFSF